MICKKPFYKKGETTPLACGKCASCRINARDMWSTRLQIESLFEDRPQMWITLTYDDQNLPHDNQLNYQDISEFLKRLRRRYEEKIRFFVSGEYGAKGTKRPHYHMYIGGVGTDSSRKLYKSKRSYLNYYSIDEAKLIQSWGMGDIDVQHTSPRNLKYSCKHIAKSIKERDLLEEGRSKMFHRQSQGIGRNAIPVLTEWLYSGDGARHLAETGDVPTVIKLGQNTKPMPRYIVNKLRQEFGLEQKTPAHIKLKYEIENQEKVKIYGYDHRQKKAILHDHLSKSLIRQTLNKRL